MPSNLFRRLRPRSVYDVCAALALFVALGGTAYAVNTVNSTDIVDGEVKSVDVGDGEVKSADVKDQSLTTFDVSTFLGADIVDGTITGDDLGTSSVQSAEVADGSLKDEDIGENAFVHFQANIGVVPAHDCSSIPVTGTAAQGDHLLLTPDWNTTVSELSYTAEYRTDVDQVVITVCNPTNGNITDGFTNFNLLVINAN